MATLNASTGVRGGGEALASTLAGGAAAASSFFWPTPTARRSCALRVRPRARSNQNGAPSPIRKPASNTDRNQAIPPGPADHRRPNTPPTPSNENSLRVTALHLLSTAFGSAPAGAMAALLAGEPSGDSACARRPVLPSTPVQNGQYSTVIGSPVSRSSTSFIWVAATFCLKRVTSSSVTSFSSCSASIVFNASVAEAGRLAFSSTA